MTASQKLRLILDSIDSLPEPIRQFYRPGDGDLDGKFVLDAEEQEGWSIANVANATAGLTSARTKMTAAEKAKARIEGELKKERDRVAELEAQVAELETSGGKFDRSAAEARISKEIAKQYEAQIAEVKQALEAQQGTNKTLAERFDHTLIGASIRELASGGKFKFPLKLLEPQLRGRTKIEVDEETGERRVVVLDANGQPKVGSGGRSATLEDVLVEFTRDPELGAVISRIDQQRGTDGGNRNGSAGGRVSTPSSRVRVLTQEELSDSKLFQAAKAEALAAGQSISLPNQPSAHA